MEEAGRQTVRHGSTVSLPCHADTKTKGHLKSSDGLLSFLNGCLLGNKQRRPYFLAGITGAVAGAASWVGAGAAYAGMNMRSEPLPFIHASEVALS